MRLILGAKLHGCEKCGEMDPDCLDMHHVDPAKKSFALSTKFNVSLGRLLAEIAKCAVLCANCHRKHHARLARG